MLRILSFDYLLPSLMTRSISPAETPCFMSMSFMRRTCAVSASLLYSISFTRLSILNMERQTMTMITILTIIKITASVGSCAFM